MIVVALILLGLCLGSFVNALVWRLHKQSPEAGAQSLEQGKKHKALSPKLSAEYSILRGHSMCPHCRHRLAVDDLVPVLSWLALKGKCRYCKKKISWQYPLVEAATAILFVLSYVFWPMELSGSGLLALGSWLLLLTGFIALIVYDLRWMLLPNRIIFPLLGLALFQTLLTAMVFGDGWELIWQAALGAAVGGGIFYILFQGSKGAWIGGGDVKLGFLLGLVLGSPGKSLLMIFVASLLGTLVAVPLLLGGRASRSTRLPFGPFLIIAAIIVQLFGAALVQWYQRQFLFY